MMYDIRDGTSASYYYEGRLRHRASGVVIRDRLVATDSIRDGKNTGVAACLVSIYTSSFRTAIWARRTAYVSVVRMDASFLISALLWLVVVYLLEENGGYG